MTITSELARHGINDSRRPNPIQHYVGVCPLLTLSRSSSASSSCRRWWLIRRAAMADSPEVGVFGGVVVPAAVFAHTKTPAGRRSSNLPQSAPGGQPVPAGIAR